MDGLIRNTFAIVGALSVVGMLKGVVTLQEDLLFVVHGIQSITRPFWQLLLGWTWSPLPDLAADYLTMAAVSAGMRLRAIRYMWAAVGDGDWSEVVYRVPFSANRLTAGAGDAYKFHLQVLPLRVLSTFLFWPVALASSSLHYISGRWQTNLDGADWVTEEAKQVSRKQYLVFFETMVWLLVILAANYALFLAPDPG